MKTKVIFRKWKDTNTVLALFPEELERNGFVSSYEHVGQHGAADYVGCISITKPATPEEFAGLKQELESIGYDLDVRKRR
jgi:hypothetical protein